MIEIDSGYLRGLGIVCPTHKLEIKERKMTSKETIQQLKEDIAILQEKLKKLEELARVKTPAEEAFYRIYSRYPDKLDDRYGSAWDIFVVGYNEAHKDAVENNKNFEPTPQTPEQVEQGLRDAMKKAKEDGVFEKPKPKTLYDVIYEWKYDTYDPTCDVLLDMIEEWLPDDEFDPNEPYEIGWNEAIQAIKEKIR
jgi:hypothetical protein